MDTQKLNIACIFEGNLHNGGGFQTQLSTIVALNEYQNYQITAFTFSKENHELLVSNGLKTIYIKVNFLDKIFKILSLQEWFYIFSSTFKLKTFFEKSLVKHHIDLIYFLAPSSLALSLVSHNYIYTIWDLCHRDMPEFPEVNYFREFEIRESIYNKAPKKAIAVLTDSELGRDNAIRRYNLDSNRVFSASFVPSANAKKTGFLDIKKKYQVDGEYIYYPAQFWAHKNHVYIIDAIAKLKEKGIFLTAIFSGSDKGNLDYVLNYAQKLNVADLVRYIGFAPDDEIYHLYKQSLALVMPSYFGPTNIPPLEAFAIGTPVIYSDLAGLREQVADAALLCDLKNPQNLVEHLRLLLHNPDRRLELIEQGYRRLNELQKTSVSHVLMQIFDDFLIKLKCWKS
ncbi:MAG TPA: glycosyltransferase family 1 protein [Acinetobacter johnsonii]|nr:glycosyltransferase family 1 protein [Acinetobacter johnsonii]